MHETVDRVVAAQATVDAYRGKTFAWGRYDCARLAAFTLKALGYKPNISRFGFYKSALSAARALKREGFADVAAWLDDIGLPRIPQAATLPGDIVGFSHDDLEAITGLRTGLGIALGNGRILAFLDDRICHVVSPNLAAPGAEYLAWRATPRPAGPSQQEGL